MAEEKPVTAADLKALEKETLVAELIARRTEAKLRQLEAEERIRVLRERRETKK